MLENELARVLRADGSRELQETARGGLAVNVVEC